MINKFVRITGKADNAKTSDRPARLELVKRHTQLEKEVILI